MFARNLLKTIFRNNITLMITRSQFKNQNLPPPPPPKNPAPSTNRNLPNTNPSPNENPALRPNQCPAPNQNYPVFVYNNNVDKIFYLKLNGKKAYIKYRIQGNKITLFTTQVPEALKGLGLGKALAQGAFNYIACHNLKMEVRCSFLHHYLNKYGPEYKDFLVKKNRKK